jgi:integrase
MSLRWSSAHSHGGHPTIGDISNKYLESLLGDEDACENARLDLQNHILPKFGRVRLDQIGESDMLNWLASMGNAASAASDADPQRIRRLLDRMWGLAVDLRIADPDANPLAGSLRFDRRGQGEALLSIDEVQRLLLTATTSPNRQLKYIVALLMLTGARTGEILNVCWHHVDLAAGSWHVHVPGAENARELHLTGAAVALLRELPRFSGCDFVVPNPATKKPYRSLNQSWNVVKVRAMLPHLELDDLRYCDLGTAIWEERFLALLQPEEDSEAAELS